LKSELGEKAATIRALEAREQAMKEKLRATGEEFNERLEALRKAELALAEKEAELAKLSADLDQRAVDSESQRIETVALNTQIEALKSRVAEFEQDLENTDNRLKHERTATEAAAQELGGERAKVAGLDGRIVELEKQLAAQTTEAETLGKRTQDMEARLSEQGRLLAQREHQYEQANAQLANAQRIESELRAELAALAGRHDTTGQAVHHEKTLLSEQLDKANQERAKLQGELADIKRDAESSWAAERVENALLRERINDIAAEIARLTAALEGTNSPIDQMLTQQAAQTLAVTGAQMAAGESETAPSLIPAPRTGGNLADRIRALQNRATRQTAN
jgi:chromosome segregation ATPase